MKRLPTLALLVAFALGLTGCGLVARDLGYAGAHPGYMKCKGKVGLSGSGTLALGAGVGGASTNSFSINGDCGDGFEFAQGVPAPEAVIPPAGSVVPPLPGVPVTK
jgi:hypothetical protein